MSPDSVLIRYEELADSFVKAEYPKALLQSFLLYAAILLATVGAGLFFYSFLRNKPAYVAKVLTPKLYHYGLMLVSVILALLQFGRGGLYSIICAAGATVFAVAGAVLSLLNRWVGPVLTTLSVWIAFPVREAFRISAVFQDYADIGQYNAASKYCVYAADRMILGRVAASILIVGVLTVINVIYYTKRRYLFRSSYERCFSGCTCCPTCKTPLVCHTAFCPGCGTSLDGMPQSELAWEPLYKPKYCTECGSRLNANGDCPNCDPEGTLSNHIKALFGTDIVDTIKKVVFAVLAAVVLFVPVFFSSWPGTLVSDSVQPNNNYVNKLKEWRTAPALAADPDWITEFDAASRTLTDVNARLFQTDPDRLRYRELYSYIQYAEASYRQTAVMQKLDESVHSGDASEAPTLLALFDKTLNQQQNALAQGIKLSTGSKLEAAESAALDSIRFYFSFIPTFVLACVFFVAALSGFTAGIILLSKHRNSDPFVRREEDVVAAEERNVREARYRRYRRGESVLALIGTVAAVVLIGVSLIVTVNTNAKRAPAFADCVHAAYTSYGTEIISWLSDCETDPEKARASCDRMNDVIMDCREQLTAVIESGEADEELVLVSTKLKDALASLETELSTGRLPDKNTSKTITGLLLEGMKQDVQMLVENALEALSD